MHLRNGIVELARFLNSTEMHFLIVSAGISSMIDYAFDNMLEEVYEKPDLDFKLI
jgi:2-hydroxy-3-keto-5-methylthiopentenyl-1-phosphate phosphatase